MRIVKRAVDKTAAKRGFSLSELMIVLVIMAVISMAIAIGISSAAQSYRDIKTATESSMLCSALVAELSDTLRYATDIQSGSGGDAVFTHRRYGVGVSVKPSSDGKKVVVGGKPVLSDSAYTGLFASAKVTYSGTMFTLIIKVFDYDNKTELRSETLNITPITA